MASHCCCSVVRLYSLIQLLLHHGITVIMTLTFTRCFVSQRCKTGWGAGSWAQTGGGSVSTMDSDIHRAEKNRHKPLKIHSKKTKTKNKNMTNEAGLCHVIPWHEGGRHTLTWEQSEEWGPRPVLRCELIAEHHGLVHTGKASLPSVYLYE